MISRQQIETILKINGLDQTAPDEHIKSVLISARFNQDEVDTALTVLRENNITKEVRADGMHKIFSSSETLQPHEIAELLHINVESTSFAEPETNWNHMVIAQYIFVIVGAFTVAAAGLMYYMYQYEIGFFNTDNQAVTYSESLQSW
jgi:hypothetical protein